MLDLIIKNGKVYIDGKFKKLNIGVKDGKIVYIGKKPQMAIDGFDASNCFVLPGLIDPHVHFALYCGTITSVDDFYYGSKTAAYGGVTTIVDFLDPSRNAKELVKTFKERSALAKNCNVDYHFHACIKEPNGDLEKYVLKMKELGINTVKLFTTYSETHRRTYDTDIIDLLKLSKKYDFMVEAHIENDEMINKDNSLPYSEIANARSTESERVEALKLCKYAVDNGGHLYMVHCSSGYTLKEIIKRYKKYLGKNIFIESCPQYFTFNKDILKSEKGYLYTFAPPLRSEEERKLMCVNFKYVNAIGTDHCSFNSKDKKSHPLLKGHPLGIGGIENSYCVLENIFGNKVIDKMSINNANLQRLSCKNGIKLNNCADFAIVKNEKNVIGKPHGKANYSVYENMEVKQKVVATILRGKFLIRDGKFYENKGRLINCDKQ